MEQRQFSDEQLARIEEAVEIAEDLISNHYKISTSSWRRMRYEVKTLMNLHPEELTNDAFAQVVKYSRSREELTRLDRRYDFYLICLMDHKILEAVEEESRLDLPAFAVYILTHELVHVVRFTNFKTMFDVPAPGRDKEEKQVHAITYEILRNRKWPSLQFVLDSYAPFRKIDEVLY